jgi:hypothetical protein
MITRELRVFSKVMTAETQMESISLVLVWTMMMKYKKLALKVFLIKSLKRKRSEIPL